MFLAQFFLNIFINDLSLQIKTVKLNVYADDGQLHTTDTNTDLVSSVVSFISREVNSANAGYEINRMIVNPSKCQGILFFLIFF